VSRIAGFLPHDQRRSPTPPSSSGVGLFVRLVSLKKRSLSIIPASLGRNGRAMSGSRRMIRNVEPQRGRPIARATGHLQRPPQLTVRGSVDAGLRPRSLAPNAPPPAASARAGRPCRSTVKAIGPWHRRLAGAFGRHFPFNITSTCQARRLGIQSNSHVRLDAAGRHLRVRPAHGSRIAPMPGMCRYVALATYHE
jgi:hypothetical protein